MSKFEIYLSKDDLEYIANGYDIKIKINGKRFLETNEIILKPALINDVIAPDDISPFEPETLKESVVIGNIYENAEMVREVK